MAGARRSGSSREASYTAESCLEARGEQAAGPCGPGVESPVGQHQQAGGTAQMDAAEAGLAVCTGHGVLTHHVVQGEKAKCS